MIGTSDTLLNELKGDNAHDAWKRFYNLYWSSILGYSKNLGLDANQAEEVLQETMVVLMRVLPEFVYDRKRGLFRNFLLTVVHRKCLEALRRARRRNDRELPLTEAVDASVVEYPAANVELGEEEFSHWRETLFVQALHELRLDPSLGENTFAVFEAYVVARRPAGVVAREFGLKENAVYQIKNRLIRRLENRVACLIRASGGE